MISLCIWTKQIGSKVVIHGDDDYQIYEIFNLLTAKECQTLIDIAKEKGLHESKVYNHTVADDGQEVDIVSRKSETTWLKDTEHPTVLKLARITSEISRIPIENQEALQVAHYHVNGMFNEHYDACHYTDLSQCEKMNNGAGQRRCTLLVYLNDDFEGGETEFRDIKAKIKPEVGKAVFFWDTYPDEKIIDKSKHIAHRIRQGEKWICTKWAHVKPYPNS